MDSALLAPGTVFHGRYHVQNRIAAGGMGAVYEVRDEKTDKRRALKVMLPAALEDPDFRSRFEREAKVTGAIESDHVVHVSDAGIDDATGTPFLVMELLKGEELGRVLKKSGPLPPAEALVYLFQTALGLDKTHAAGIVHRDLKPQNLFLTRADDGSPRVKILDFGIAKVVAPGGDANSTRALGTPKYMAPEQVRGEKTIGPRTDIYALGHIAYALLTAESYWTEEEKAANDALFVFLSKVVAGADESAVKRALRRRNVTLPPEFDVWFEQCTAVDPNRRFATAGAAVSALAQALGLPERASVSAGFTPIPLPTSDLAPVSSKGSSPERAPTAVATVQGGEVAITHKGWGTTMGSPAARSRKRTGMFVAGGALFVVVALGGARLALSPDKGAPAAPSPAESAAATQAPTTGPVIAPASAGTGPVVTPKVEPAPTVSAEPSGASKLRSPAKGLAASPSGQPTSTATAAAAARPSGAVVDPWATPKGKPAQAPSAPPAPTKPGMF